MKIKSIETKNFKNAPDLKYDLDKVNVFIGKNGHGKTSVENAIRFSLSGKLPPDPIRHGKEKLEVTTVIEDGQDAIIKRVNYNPDVFQIDGENVKGAVFVKAVEKQEALYKKSNIPPKVLLLNSNPDMASKAEMYPEYAFTFMKTGKTTIPGVSTKRISGVKELELEFPDKSIFYMRKTEPSGVYIDGKKTTAKAMDQMISSWTSSDAKALDIVTSSEVMSAMNMVEFAEYLITIVPAKMDFNKLSVMLNMSNEEKNILAGLFPPAPTPITTKDVKTVYDSLKAQRTEIGRSLLEWEKRSSYNGSLPIMNKHTVTEKLQELMKIVGNVEKQKEAMDVYEKRVNERNHVLSVLVSWNTEYTAMPDVTFVKDTDIQKLAAYINALREKLRNIEKNISSLETSNVPIRKMLDNLDTSICPLCSTLTCRTDKTDCRNDLMNSITTNNQVISNLSVERDNIRRNIDIYEKNLNIAQTMKAAFEKKEMLRNKITAFKATIPELPVKPDPIADVTLVNEEITKYKRYLQECTLYESALQAQKEYKKYKYAYDLYTDLIKKAEPKKGLFTNTILSSILMPFCDHCNKFLSSIYGDMEIEFKMSDDGLQVYVRPHNRKDFLPIYAVSTGEKLLVTFALMDMLSTISNMRILIFDCLEMLDPESLDNLLSVLLKDEVQNRYDNIILSVVEHESIRKVVNKHKSMLNIIDF